MNLTSLFILQLVVYLNTMGLFYKLFCLLFHSLLVIVGPHQPHWLPIIFVTYITK